MPAEKAGETAPPPKTKSRNPQFDAARAKGQETRRMMGTISRAKKLEAERLRKEEYEKALAILNPKAEPEKIQEEEPQAAPAKKPAKKKKVIEISDSSSDESEESESEEEEIEVIRVKRKPAAAKKKPAKASKAKKAPPKRRKRQESSEEDSDSSSEEEQSDGRLAGTVARDMLKRRVLQKAADDAIRMLVPGYRGPL